MIGSNSEDCSRASHHRDRPAATDQGHPPRKRWRLRVLIASAVLFVGFIGPWPAYEDGYAGDDYARTTFARLRELPMRPTVGPIMAGASTVDIMCKPAEPLAGYGARRPKANDGVLDQLFARAISISNGYKCVTIVGGDILLVLPHLRDAIISRAAVPRDELYFTATHTHSGIGGYAPSWIEQTTLGYYDEAILRRLADAFATAISRSRADLKPATIDLTVAILSADAAPVANRIDEISLPDRTMACMALRGVDGKAIGGMVTFAAHATCLGHRNHKISGDYPGIVQRGLSERLGGTWMLAAGAVGSMKPRSSRPRGPERVKDVGDKVLSLACALATGRQPEGMSVLLSSANSSHVVLSSAILEVDLPQTQFRISRNWRLSPLLTSHLHARKTYIHALRINGAVLLAYPADYSGELHRRLLAEVGGDSLVPIATSFNGDYIGYCVGRDRYDLDHYESRTMNFFGPACGDYFQELSARLLERMSTAQSPDKSQLAKELP